MDTLNTRQKSLLSLIQNQGAVSVQALFNEIEASEATIRRDLIHLENHHLIVRRRGEVFAVKKSLESAFQQREHLNKEAKQIIAHIAANQIQEHDTIILDAGTTTLEIARLLTNYHDLTILTNSLPIANIIAPSRLSLSLAGGHLFSQNMSTQGPDAEEFFKKVEVGKSFIGASGIRRLVGLETLNPFEAEIKKLMVDAAKKVYGVVDSSKFDTAGINVFCNFSDLDFLITDKPIRDEETLALLKRQGVEVLLPS
nr:DeoR/GlpR family DNA-binding transcription regulator [uncultured Sphaerochaeta sp.]